MDGVHDLGGMHGFGPVVEPGGEDDVPRALGAAGLRAAPAGVVPAARRGARRAADARGRCRPREYLDAGYYERWLWSAERRLERAGTIAPGEVEAMMARLARGRGRRRSAQRRRPWRSAASRRSDDDADGARRASTARASRPATACACAACIPEGHTRCPRYARGVAGTVQRVHGTDRAARPRRPTACRPTPRAGLRGRLPLGRPVGRQDGEPPFTVLLDLWDSYLDPEDAA